MDILLSLSDNPLICGPSARYLCHQTPHNCVTADRGVRGGLPEDHPARHRRHLHQAPARHECQVSTSTSQIFLIIQSTNYIIFLMIYIHCITTYGVQVQLLHAAGGGVQEAGLLGRPRLPDLPLPLRQGNKEGTLLSTFYFKWLKISIISLEV